MAGGGHPTGVVPDGNQSNVAQSATGAQRPQVGCPSTAYSKSSIPQEDEEVSHPSAHVTT